MGLLDQVIGGVLGSRARGPGGMSPIMMAIMALLASRSMGQGGGLGDILGGALGGSQADPRRHPAPDERGGGTGGGLGDILGGILGGGAAGRDVSGRAAPGTDGLGGMLDNPNDPRGTIRGGGPFEDEERGQGGGFGGGLGDLLDRFNQRGRGDIADSWVGHGENRPIGPDELEDTLGDDTVEDLSRRSGMPRGDLLSELSTILPSVIDKLTPQGRVPDRRDMERW